MGNFIDLMKGFEDCFTGKGAKDDAIAQAEHELSLKFADDYKKYLRECGVASADGHEFTGLIESKRLNVVDATLAWREKQSSVPEDLYVVENLQMDGIVILQAADGKVYKTILDEAPKYICDSLYEYFKTSTDYEDLL